MGYPPRATSRFRRDADRTTWGSTSSPQNGNSNPDASQCRTTPVTGGSDMPAKKLNSSSCTSVAWLDWERGAYRLRFDDHNLRHAPRVRHHQHSAPASRHVAPPGEAAG